LFDVIIIGAGICGASVARFLSQYKLKIAVLEKGSDVCVGTSRSNSATVHSGHDALPGTQKARFNVLGNAMYDQLCQELSVPFKRNGTVIFATNEKDMHSVCDLKKQADINGVPGAEVLSREQLLHLEPGFGARVLGGLFAPTGGIVCPYTLVIHSCYSAVQNGVEFHRNTAVAAVKKDGGAWSVLTDKGRFRCNYIFNCAGVNADIFNNMVSEQHFHITPRKGEHLVLDKSLAPFAKATICQTPTDLPGGGHTKGMGLMPSMDGTLILGCPAYDSIYPEDTATMRGGVDEILNYFRTFWDCFPISSKIPVFPEPKIISSFCGVRAHPDTDDFIVGEAEDAPGFFNAAGIESPGLTAGPAIGKHLAELASDKYGFIRRTDYNPFFYKTKPFREMTEAERQEAFIKDPDYGRLVCRCEQVTLAEIKAAIHAPIGAEDINAVKMRTRAGMGRCQGGFCSPEILRILSKELQRDPLSITQCGGCSKVLLGKVGIC